MECFFIQIHQMYYSVRSHSHRLTYIIFQNPIEFWQHIQYFSVLVPYRVLKKVQKTHMGKGLALSTVCWIEGVFLRNTYEHSLLLRWYKYYWVKRRWNLWDSYISSLLFKKSVWSSDTQVPSNGKALCTLL